MGQGFAGATARQQTRLPNFSQLPATKAFSGEPFQILVELVQFFLKLD